ncbi:MAG: hypothetical protein ACR2P2_18830 [Nakamurella sp.]
MKKAGRWRADDLVLHAPVTSEALHFGHALSSHFERQHPVAFARDVKDQSSVSETRYCHGSIATAPGSAQRLSLELIRLLEQRVC